MKKFIFPFISVILLFWILAGKCTSPDDKALYAKQDSLQHIVDSLNVSIAKKDSAIDELNKIDADLNYQVLQICLPRPCSRN